MVDKSSRKRNGEAQKECFDSARYLSVGRRRQDLPYRSILYSEIECTVHTVLYVRPSLLLHRTAGWSGWLVGWTNGTSVNELESRVRQ
jgi:hypothetical protein